MRHLEVLIGVTHSIHYPEEDTMESLKRLLVMQIVTDLV
jgi:hypothetical protein